MVKKLLIRCTKVAAAIAKPVVRTFAQTLGAMLTAAGTGILDTAWTTSLSVAGMAAFLALLTNVGNGVKTTADVDPAPGQD